MPAHKSSHQIYFVCRFNRKLFIKNVLLAKNKQTNKKIPVAIEKLLYLTTSQSKGKFMYPYVPWSEMR